MVDINLLYQDLLNVIAYTFIFKIFKYRILYNALLKNWILLLRIQNILVKIFF